ncbi:MAG: cell division protein SepF [Actinomycetota bacterium]|jgi:cell division inhibitor SepF|nr:cell division protein SepF [Actinomycetota bacterium]
MSGLIRKTLAFLGFSDPEEYDQENIQEDSNEEDYDLREKYYGGGRSGGSSRSKRKVSFLNPVKPEPKSKVFIAEPHNFEEMQIVGQNFKSAIPVIINLQNTNMDLSKRIIDFCSGMTFALEGSIQKVADRVYLITPYNVEVNSEDKELLKEKGLFNQF